MLVKIWAMLVEAKTFFFLFGLELFFKMDE